jgi:hypothetical protein
VGKVLKRRVAGDERCILQPRTSGEEVDLFIGDDGIDNHRHSYRGTIHRHGRNLKAHLFVSDVTCGVVRGATDLILDRDPRWWVWYRFQLGNVDHSKVLRIATSTRATSAQRRKMSRCIQAHESKARVAPSHSLRLLNFSWLIFLFGWRYFRVRCPAGEGLRMLHPGPLYSSTTTSANGVSEVTNGQYEK